MDGVAGAIPYESMGCNILYFIKHKNDMHVPAVLQKSRVAEQG